jgi:IS30 family transposase
MERLFLQHQIAKKEVAMSHLTKEQRYTISVMRKEGYSQRAIAESIDKDKSVISRELKRNKDQRSGEYRYELALKKCRERHKTKPKQICFTNEIKTASERLLKLDYSPQQVVGILKKHQEASVSVETLYQHIWNDKKYKGVLHKHLRHQGRRYRKRGAAKDSRGIIKNRVSIEKRPSKVELRDRFGDLEVDLIIGKNHNQAILTINDRSSGMLKMKKIPSKESKGVGLAIIDLLEDWKPYLKTITADNGKEFADHLVVAQELNIDYYFARPYHSWERGSNENLNGLIRQYLPKKTDFTKITDCQVKQIQEKLNLRPRKRFNYENPIFVMDQLLFNPEVAFMT